MYLPVGMHYIAWRYYLADGYYQLANLALFPAQFLFYRGFKVFILMIWRLVDVFSTSIQFYGIAMCFLLNFYCDMDAIYVL